MALPLYPLVPLLHTDVQNITVWLGSEVPRQFVHVKGMVSGRREDKILHAVWNVGLVVLKLFHWSLGEFNLKRANGLGTR